MKFARSSLDVMAWMSAGFLCALFCVAIFAPLISPYDPGLIDSESVLSSPSIRHLFGTDLLGRDLLSRIVYGSRVSLAVSIVAIAISVVIGVACGAVSGYYGGWVDGVMMRFVDIMLCFPTFFLILAVIAFLEPSLFSVMAVIGATSWMGLARLVRAEVLSLKTRDYVSAARVMGASDAWIIARHLVPNAAGPVVVNATLGIGGAILTESALSFLGIGVQPPTPSWGNILMDGKSTLGVAWWLMFFPAVFIIMTVLSYNIVGDWLRHRWDPRSGA